VKVEMKLEKGSLSLLEKRLTKDLPAATAKKVMRSVIMFTLKPLLDRIKEKLSDDVDLQRSVRRRVIINKSTDFQSVGGIWLSSGKNKKGFKFSGWRWHFREFGVSPHKIKTKNKGGKKSLSDGEGAFFGSNISHPGHRAKPFIRPSWDEKKASLVDRFIKQMAKKIDKAVRSKRS
jgi:hypothetical protein